jgi:competence protein ComEC
MLLPAAFSDFWRRNPAFLYGLFFAFALFAALEYYSPLILGVPIFFTLCKRQKIITITLFIAAICFVKTTYTFPEGSVTKGEGRFNVKEVKKARRGWTYKGTICTFKSVDGEDRKLRNLPCTLYSPVALDSNYDYKVEGELKQLHGKYYALKSKVAHQPIEKRVSFAAWRYETKQKVGAYINQNIPHLKSASFLSGLATGQLDDPVLLKEFERRGLSHLLAISGFHFALLGSCFYFILRPLLPPKIAAGVLMIILSAYFFFIGNQPSVQRAWLIAILFLMGQLIERPSFGLNSLGLALLVAFLSGPLSFMQAGFQLSFLATAGILILFRPIERQLRQVTASQSSIFKWTREGVALVLSVYLAIFPLLLFLFHKLPLHGMLYNLFFPFLVSISCLGLIVSTICHLIFPFFGSWLHWVNSLYTEGILNMLELPIIPHKTIYVSAFPPYLLLIYWGILFGGAIYSQYAHMRKKEFERDEFRFF